MPTDVTTRARIAVPLNMTSRFAVSEMCDGPGEDVAHGTLFLRPVRQTVRRGRVPRERGPSLLQGRLLRHVRSQVRRMQSANNGKLRLGPIRPMAFQLLRVQGKPQFHSKYTIF